MVGLDDLRGLFLPMILCFSEFHSLTYKPLVDDVVRSRMLKAGV